MLGHAAPKAHAGIRSHTGATQAKLHKIQVGSSRGTHTHSHKHMHTHLHTISTNPAVLKLPHRGVNGEA